MTVMQQCVYQMKFKNVCEVKKQLVKSGLVWSITLSIPLTVNGKIVFMFVIAQLTNILISYVAGS